MGLMPKHSETMISPLAFQNADTAGRAIVQLDVVALPAGVSHIPTLGTRAWPWRWLWSINCE